MNILSPLIEVSIYSGVIVLVIILFKKILHKKLSAPIQFALWTLFILRLLIPVSINSGISLITYAQPAAPIVAQAQTTTPEVAPMTIENEAGTKTVIYPDTHAPIVSALPQTATVTSQQSTSFQLSLTDIIIGGWLAGILGWLISMSIAYAKLRNKILERSTVLIPSHVFDIILKCEERMGVKKPCEVRISNDYDSTVLLAALRPKLIISDKLLDKNREEALEHCLLHEFAHYKRKDYLTYLLINVLRAIYWFNPFVWIGTRLMKQDMESACDAKVIQTMDSDEQTRYAKTLLSMFKMRRMRSY